MKKLFTLLFIVLASVTLHAQEISAPATDPNAPIFEFETDVIDYGKIDINADGVRVFKFKNVGKSPLVIENISSSCGCTVPKKPTKPIMPGESGEIEVKYDTARPGGFSKTITIKSNASEPAKFLRIKGIVVKAESPIEVKKSTISS